ncbi:MAG: serine/threonine-protein phosphatase, partial [Gammaproteobacteria bacterium]|nr:serine/threonine-protein phosphatase [Gammaproteobacteria bacterium]
MNSTSFGWSSAAATHPGKVRVVNEDAILAVPERGLWVVADGMGGHQAGDVASQLIVESLAQVGELDNPAHFLDEVERRLIEVNEKLIDTAADRGAMVTIGSTVVVLLALEQHCVLAWAGDSRAYRLRHDQLEQLTADHSQVQRMIDKGQLEPEQAENHPYANVITRAVGGTDDLRLDIEVRALQAGDRYLLCSDGLYRDVSEAQIAARLRSPSCD